MNPQGPELRDIHLPPDPSWWPPAPGWWLLALVVVALSVLLLRRLQRGWRARRWQRDVVREVDCIAAAHTEHADPVRLAAELSVLLRRATLLVDPRAAALQGDAWLKYLDARIGGEAFSAGAGRALLDAPWQRAASYDTEALIDLARRWFAQARLQDAGHA